MKFKPAEEKSTDRRFCTEHICAADHIVHSFHGRRWISYVDSCRIPGGKLRTYYRLGTYIRALIVTTSDFDRIPASFQSGQSPFNWIIRPLLSRTWCVPFAIATNQPQLALRRFSVCIKTHSLFIAPNYDSTGTDLDIVPFSFPFFKQSI